MRYLFTYIFLLLFTVGCAQNTKKEKTQTNSEAIHWMSFTDAVKKNETVKKKLLIDVYTDWCGWCKRMDASTYQNKQAVAYINKNFYPVKLDAEMSDSIVFQNHVFRKTDATKKSAPHELAVALLNGKMGYPSTVFLDENFNMLSPVQGYLSVEQLEMYMKYFTEVDYTKVKWEDFQSNFKSTFNE